MNVFRSRLILFVALAASVASAHASIAFSFPDGKEGQLIQPGFDAVEGNLFQVGASDIHVTMLGYERQRANQGPELTAIFDATTGAILASASISGTDSLIGGYYYAAISGLTLHAGQRYYIGSLHGSGAGEEYIYNTRPAQTPAYLTDLGTYFKVSSTLEGGTWSYGGGTNPYDGGEVRHYVGNFIANPVPGPAAAAPLLAGISTFAVRRRRGLRTAQR